MQSTGPIGVFDSGFGGLTILKEITQKMPQYHYLYLGDNARTPYGTRSFETVYNYTYECVQWFFKQGCPLVILACNTASAKALRTIQQKDLPLHYPNKKVLGVIRPTTEIIGNYSTSQHIGVLATKGTVDSHSYPIEIQKFFPHITVHQQACPMWVPLIENNEHQTKGADFFVKEYLNNLFKKDTRIDTLLLGCTHYPLLLNKITEYAPLDTKIVTQGQIVANSLQQYLQRHIEIENVCTKQSKIEFFTTDNPADFNAKASLFWGNSVESKLAVL